MRDSVHVNKTTDCLRVVIVSTLVRRPPGTRAFMRNVEGKLRYVNGADLWLDEEGKNTLEADCQEGRTAAHEAQPHHMWLTQDE